MKDNKGNQYYLTVKNTFTGKYEKVFVSEEIYRAYKKPVRKEQSKQRRENKCLVKNKYGNLIRCTEDCKTCEYYLSGQKPGVNGLSLDVFKEQGLEIEDMRCDPEDELIKRQETEALHKAIAELTPRQQEMVRMVYYEGKTQECIADIFGISEQAVSNAMARIYASMEKKLKKF